MSDHGIRYTVRVLDAAAHMFQVELQIAAPDPAGQVLALPVWIPGSYMVRDFARNIITVTASSGGHDVDISKLDKTTWKVAPCEGPLTVVYEVYAWELTVRTAHMDRTHGFFNGTSMFLAVRGQEDQPCEVVLEPGADPHVADWRVATTLPRTAGEPWGYGTFLAADHDELVDHPVEMGDFQVVSFEACGIPHHVAVTGRVRFDEDRMATDLKAICEQHLEFFGKPYPIEAYLFQVYAVGDGYGGLEHRSSTALICKRDDLPQPGDDEVTDGYRQFLGLCSHEYFHTWNVKRLKPRVFVPYDLTGEVHTELLWWFEGVTSYYDDLGLLRAGRIDEKSWLELVGRTITQVMRVSGRLKQSVAESSYDAWTKFYRQDENAPNAIVSYYAKGSMVALALDLELRRRSGGTHSLDTLMATLWARFGDGSGVPERHIEEVCAELLGESMQDFFDHAVYGTDDLDLASLLADVGVTLHTRPAKSGSDKGGTSGPTDDTCALGATVVKGSGGALLRHVHDGGPARAAGLSAGDVVVAFDGLRVTGSDLVSKVAARQEGEVVAVHFFRRDELYTTQVTLQAAPHDTVWLTLDEDVDPEVAKAREAWLKGS